MTLDQLDKNEEAVIVKINCDRILKNRFYSLGIVKFSKLTVKEKTLTSSTLEIEINNSKIALRISEAQKIEVTKVWIK